MNWAAWITPILIWGVNLILLVYLHFLHSKWRGEIHKENLELHLRVAQLEHMVGHILSNLNKHMETLRAEEGQRH